MRGKTELAGIKLWVNEWNKPPHPFKLVKGDIAEYTLIGYRKKGYGEKHGSPVNVTNIDGNQIALEFVMVAEPLHFHTIETVPTKTCFVKTGTIIK